MDSTGNGNRLKQHSTIVEGAQIRVAGRNDYGNGNKNEPLLAVYLLLGVCCVLQVLHFFYLAHCKANLTMEMLRRDQAVEQRAEKTARRAALDALDRYMSGKRIDIDVGN